jgi:hypothetical protein
MYTIAFIHNLQLYDRFPCYFQSSLYKTQENENIGDALLCYVDIPPNTHFIAFDGIIRTMDDFKVRRDQGKGSYAVGIHGNKVLDCYDKCQTDRCLASKANNSKKLIHSSTHQNATINARINVHHRGIVTLKSLDKEIKANTEIKYSYGSRYKGRDYKS